VLGRDAFSLERVLEIEPSFLTDPHDHQHDEDIGSLCLTADRPLDPDRFVHWVQSVTQEIGADILRMKGIVAMKDDDQRFVIQGVHMLIEGGSQRPWKSDERRDSRVVFIGRDLPRARLKEGFESCLA
jgi:G3E family GTPase